jgi:hypothetical protein
MSRGDRELHVGVVVAILIKPTSLFQLFYLYAATRFLSRLTTTNLLGFNFNDLDPLLQQAYSIVATTNGIDINGAKPGDSPTAAQLQHLRAVCTEVTDAIAVWETNGPSTRSPVATTSSPSAAFPHGSDPT